MLFTKYSLGTLKLLEIFVRIEGKDREASLEIAEKIVRHGCIKGLTIPLIGVWSLSFGTVIIGCFGAFHLGRRTLQKKIVDIPSMRRNARKSLTPTSELFPFCAKHHISESDVLNHLALAFADEVEY